MPDIVIDQIDHIDIRISCDVNVAYELADLFTFEAENYKFNPKFKQGIWDGKIRLFNPMKKVLNGGLISVVKHFAKEANYTVEDRVPTPTPVSLDEVQQFFVDNDYIREDIDIRDYQWNALVESINGGRLLLESPTSSGKSLMAYMIAVWNYHHSNSKVLIVVPTTSLVLQMKGDFQDYAHPDFKDKLTIHMIFDGADKNVSADVTVSTWQSIYDFGNPKFFDQFGVVIGDEAHGFNAKSLIKIMTSLKRAHVRVGMSGTIPRKKNRLFNLMGLFGPVYTATTLEELQDKGFITKMKIVATVISYDADIKTIVGKKFATYEDEMDFLIQYEPRNNFIRNLALSRTGNTMILFRFIDHGKALAQAIKAGAASGRNVYLIYGAVKAENRDEIRKIVETEKDAIIVASYKTFSTGTNIKNLHNLIFAHPVLSFTTTMQSIGRALRLHDSKERAYLFDLADDLRKGPKSRSNHALRHFQSRLSYYDTEKIDCVLKSYKVKDQ